MERFAIIVNGWKPLTIITKRSILDIAAVVDPPLNTARDLCGLLGLEKCPQVDLEVAYFFNDSNVTIRMSEYIMIDMQKNMCM